MKPERKDPWAIAKELSVFFRRGRSATYELAMAAAGAAYYGDLGAEDCNALYGEYCAWALSERELSFRVNASKLRAIVKLVEAAPEIGCDLLFRTAAKWKDMPEPGADLFGTLTAVSRYQLRRLDKPLSDRALARFIRKTRG